MIILKRIKLHILIVATIFALTVGFYILLSPPMTQIRSALGLPKELPGARYNATVGGAEIINPYEGETYLGRITFVYHSVFIILLYATLIIFAGKYLDEKIGNLVLDLAAISTIIVVASAILYGYVSKNFFWHGTFIAGLAMFFLIGLIIMLNFKPRDLLEWNIWIAGIFLLIGGIWGAWLGSSFMHHRSEFLEALIASRFNPDLAEEDLYWRALTSHEHAMIAIALALVFFLALSINRPKENAKMLLVFTPQRLYLLGIPAQIFMAAACYSVTFFGGKTHLVITPAALILISVTLLLSLSMERNDLLKIGAVISNLAVWLGVAIPGAIAAMNLREARFIYSLPIRHPSYDWLELAYNIGHWHLLLLTWGIALLIIYIVWPENITEKNKLYFWIGIIGLIGYLIAMLGTNLYMLANPPQPYTPNPYNNRWVTLLVEPGLTLLTIAVGLVYLYYLLDFLKSYRT